MPSFHGMLQVGELKCNSAAHQSGKIEMGDEIVQINYQTVVSISIRFGLLHFTYITWFTLLAGWMGSERSYVLAIRRILYRGVDDVEETTSTQ